VDRVDRIAILNDEIEAQLIDRLLSDQGIPHLIRSYHDSALDGIYQSDGSWGHIEAPLEFRGRIMHVIEDVRSQTQSSIT
jgi:hypothetical protein